MLFKTFSRVVFFFLLHSGLYFLFKYCRSEVDFIWALGYLIKHAYLHFANSVVKGIWDSYLSKSKDILLKYYYGKSEWYLSVKVFDIKWTKVS